MALRVNLHLLASVLLPCLLQPAFAQPAIPAAQTHFDTAHGVVIADEFRWMESAGKALDPWIDAEDAYARKALDALPGRAALEARIAELWRTGMGEANEDWLDERAGHSLVMDYSLDRPRLGIRRGKGPLRILLDGEATGAEQGAAVRRAATRLSPDGRLLSVGLVERGEDKPRIRIMNVESGEWLGETLRQPLWADADGFHVTWLPDSRHLLWARNPVRTADTPDGEREWNGHVYLHRIGTDPEKDVVVFGRTLLSSLKPDDTPYPGISRDGRWAIVRVRHATPARSLWVAPFDGTRASAPFREVVASAGSILGWGVRGNHLWAIVPDGAPRHRLIRLDLSDAKATAQTVLEGEEGVLRELAVAEDAVYFGRRDGATMSLWRWSDSGAPEQIELPRPGSVDNFETGADGTGLRLRFKSALRPNEQMTVSAGSSRATPISPPPKGLPPELDQYVVSVLQAPARDGVVIPVSVLHRKDAPRDSTGFVRIEAYGCFGSSREMIFDPSNIAWLERGGTLAVAHIRGGGEYGQTWHDANVARGHATAAEDVLDVVEYLVRDGWTAPHRVALFGASCGAATVGVAALARPDLIAAASLHVGGVDEWRAWSETASGARSVYDIGDPATALGVRRLLAASPYHRLLRGVRQPAFFLLNGGTDYTIPLWMGAKFVARARSMARPDSGPLLFRVERDAGHSGPVGFDAQLRSYTDDLAFQLWQLGHPDFQPAEPGRKADSPES